MQNTRGTYPPKSSTTISRDEIIKYLEKSKLIETCVQYRLNRCKDKEMLKEMVQETWVWALTYDLDKMVDAYLNGHLSALITRFICNQYFSRTSAFYRQFKKFDLFTDEISDKERQIPDDIKI